MYIRDAYAAAHPDYSLKLRIVNTQAWQNLFCNIMFLRLKQKEIAPAMCLTSLSSALWDDKEEYDKKATELTAAFIKKFSKYADYANDEILAGAPHVEITTYFLRNRLK